VERTVRQSGRNALQNICISSDILWRVFCILTEPVPYTFVSVNRRNNEARAHVEMWARCSVKIRETRHRISVDIRGHFLQCGANAVGRQ